MECPWYKCQKENRENANIKRHLRQDDWKKEEEEEEEEKKGGGV